MTFIASFGEYVKKLFLNNYFKIIEKLLKHTQKLQSTRYKEKLLEMLYSQTQKTIIF